MKQITAEAGHGAGILFVGTVDSSHDTVREAKATAIYYLTTEYRSACESSERLTYARVMVDGVCVWDLDKS